MQLEDHLDVESKVRVVAVLLKRGKAEDALEIVEKTLPLCPDHVALIAHRGDCYLRLGNAPAVSVEVLVSSCGCYFEAVLCTVALPIPFNQRGCGSCKLLSSGRIAWYFA